GDEPAHLMDELLARGINVSLSTTSGTRLDMEARGLTAMVRASVHYYNSEDEIARFSATLASLM
ncbi:MAG: aminotransferase, partial [Thermomicrobiales bacterium]